MRFLFKRCCGERLSKETLLKVDWRHTSKPVTGVALNRFTLALKHRNTGSIDQSRPRPFACNFLNPKGTSARFSFLLRGRLCPQASRNPGFRTGAFFLFGQGTAAKVPAVGARSVRQPRPLARLPISPRGRPSHLSKARALLTNHTAASKRGSSQPSIVCWFQAGSPKS